MKAESIAKALGGRKVGSDWLARCPAHDDRTPSLSIRDSENGKVLVRCHAGCDQGDVVSHLKASGLWGLIIPRIPLRGAAPLLIAQREPHPDDTRRTSAARSIWWGSKLANQSLVETYLASRKLSLPETLRLRFHPSLKHPSGESWPAMVALVTDGVSDEPVGIHRTFLARTGTGKALVNPQKMMLGPCRGGAVRLATPVDLLMIGEGIETCVAAMQATGLPAWAALSASGLQSLDIPTDVRNVIVLADGDPQGELAAYNCALRLTRRGHQVRIARPPAGLDFNDMLVDGVRSSVGDAR